MFWEAGDKPDPLLLQVDSAVEHTTSRHTNQVSSTTSPTLLVKILPPPPPCAARLPNHQLHHQPHLLV